MVQMIRQQNGCKNSLLKILFLLCISTSTVFAQSTPVLLDNWIQEGLLSNGNWTVSADNRSVLQSINGAPTFFVSPDTFINTTFEGQFSVRTTSDNDFIGFVFGFNRPIGEEEFFDFYLFDWKQGNQSIGGYFAPAGFTLARVQGTVTGNLTGGNHPYWNHSDTTITILDTLFADTLGWQDSLEYNFELLYETNRIRIKIDDTEIFDVQGKFPAGRFGFYNYSQALVRYQGFTLNEFPIAADDSITIPEDSMYVASVLENDADPDDNELRILSASPPANGSVSIASGDTTLIYTPNLNFFGQDSLDYIVDDGFGGTDTARVYFTITPRNDPPTVEVPIADTTLSQNSGLIFIAKLNNVFADVDPNDMPLENFSVGSDNEIIIPSLAGDSLYLAAPSGASGIDTIRVTAIDDSVASAEDVFIVNILVPSSVEDEPASIPEEFTVYANYPNPFNPSTKIRYYLPKRSQVTVTVFDIAGGLISTLVNDYQGPGLEEVSWNAVDQQGNAISSGVYLYRVEAAGRIETRKMIYIK